MGKDWRSRAVAVSPPSDWRSRAQPAPQAPAQEESSFGASALKLGLAGVPGIGPFGAAALTAKNPKELASIPLAALQGVTLNHADEAVTALEAAKNSAFSDKTYAEESARLGPMNERMFNEASDAQPLAHMAGGFAIPGPGQLIKAGGVAGALGRTALAAGEGALASHGADVNMGSGAALGALSHGLVGEIAPFLLGRVRAKATPPPEPVGTVPPSNAPPYKPPQPTNATLPIDNQELPPELAKTHISAPRPAPSGPLVPPPVLKKGHPGAHFDDLAPITRNTNKGGRPRPLPPPPAPVPTETQTPMVIPGRGPRIEPPTRTQVMPGEQKMRAGQYAKDKAFPAEQPYAESQHETVRQQVMEFLLRRVVPPDVARGVAAGAMRAGNKIAQAVEAASSTPQKAASLLQAMNEDEDFRSEQRKRLGVD